MTNAQKLPKRIGGFELLKPIGRGAMGAVFKARQISLDRIVALKVLPPKFAEKNPKHIERFIREARISARLNHQNIVQGIEVGQDEKYKLYYFAMELVDGGSVGELIKAKGKLEEGEALRIGLAIANALNCAHKAGIVHRDIKPDNILLTAQGEPKLADLGLAKSIADRIEWDEKDSEASEQGNAALTQVGRAVGTPYYMSPEQVMGKTDRIDIRADLYALGATLYHLISGQVPFNGTTTKEIMRKRLKESAPSLKSIVPEINPGTVVLIEKLMQLRPEQRLQTPQETILALEKILENPNPAASSSQGIAAPRRRTMMAYRSRQAQSGGNLVKTVVALLMITLAGYATHVYLSENDASQRQANRRQFVSADELLTPVEFDKSAPGSGTAKGDEQQQTGSTATKTASDKTQQFEPVAQAQEERIPDDLLKLQSTDADENATRSAALKLETVETELGEFLKRRAYEAAGSRLEKLIAEYPDSEYYLNLQIYRDSLSWHIRFNEALASGVQVLQKYVKPFSLKLCNGRNITLQPDSAVRLIGIDSDQLLVEIDEGKKLKYVGKIAFHQCLPETLYAIVKLGEDKNSTGQQLSFRRIQWMYYMHAQGDLKAWTNLDAVMLEQFGAAQDSPPQVKKAAELLLSIRQPALAIVGAESTGNKSRPIEKAPRIAPRKLELKLPDKLSLELVRIPAGKFMMGTRAGLIDPANDYRKFKFDRDEMPAHWVHIGRPFYMATCEVSVEQYHSVLEGSSSGVKAKKLPMTQVSWHEAIAFCKKLSEFSGREVTLPTEAQWEYACKAGSAGAFIRWDDPQLDDPRRGPKKPEHWQSANIAVLGPFAWTVHNAKGKLQPVGTRMPNPWGLYDMYGNVSEWCLDWFAPFANREQTDPAGPEQGKYKIAKGGGVDADLLLTRAEARLYMEPNLKKATVGFRIVVNTDEEGKVAP